MTRHTANVTLELVGTLRVRSNTSDFEVLCKCEEAKFPGKKRVALKELTLSKKDLDVAVNGREAERQQTGLQAVELGNGGRLVLFRLKDTTILYTHRIVYVCYVLSP